MARAAASIRNGSLRRLIPAVASGILLAGALSGDAVRAAPDRPALTIELETPEKLVRGDRARIVARVRPNGVRASPMLLTSASEGTAIDVVRGRLLAAGAPDSYADELRFEIPIVARTSGTGVLRVRALAYRCTGRCRAVHAEASVVLRVERE